jgi:hypothetical protein
MALSTKPTTMKVGFYGHVRQYHHLKGELDAAIHEVLESGQYVQGPTLKRFEDELAAYVGAKYAIGVGNGTDALWLTFMALGLGAGDELMTNANTFFATAGRCGLPAAPWCWWTATRRPSALIQMRSEERSHPAPGQSCQCTCTGNARRCVKSARLPTNTAYS